MNHSPITNNEELANFILNISKPFNVYLLEYLAKFKFLRRLSPFVYGLVFPLIISIIGAPWIIIGIIKGPKAPLVYILGYFAVAGAAYFPIMGTHLLYIRAKERLEGMGRYLKIKFPPTNLSKWGITFSIRKQLLTSILVAIFAATLIGFTSIVFDKPNPVTVISATLGGLVVGFIIGSGIHLFVNFPSSAARFYLENISEVYKIIPSETSGLKYLFGVTVDFMLIGSTTGTLCLFGVILYLVNAGPLQQKSTYIPAIVVAIFIVIVALIMLFLSMVIFNRHSQNEKNQTLTELQALINKKYKDINNGNSKSEIFDEIERLSNLYNRVRSSSSSPLDINAIRGVLASVFIPFVPTLIDLSLKWIFPQP